MKIINAEVTHGIPMTLLRRPEVGYTIVDSRTVERFPQARLGQLEVYCSSYNPEIRAEIRQACQDAGAVLAIEEMMFERFFFDPLPVEETSDGEGEGLTTEGETNGTV